MTHELDVLPVLGDPSKPSYRDTHENILSPPFRCALIGASKSGKTNLLMNYLRPCYYGGSKKDNIKNCFDRIVVFSPNLGMDSTSRALHNLCDPQDIHMTYSDKIIQGLIDQQSNTDSEVRDKVLLILDDLIAMGCSDRCLAFTGLSFLRHQDVSVLILSQTYKGTYSLPPIARNNIDGLIMFRSPSAHQVNSLCEDLSGTFGTKNNIYNMLSYTTRKPYNFCFFNYRDLSVYHNHTSEIWRKYTEDGDFSDEFVIPKNSEITESSEK